MSFQIYNTNIDLNILAGSALNPIWNSNEMKSIPIGDLSDIKDNAVLVYEDEKKNGLGKYYQPFQILQILNPKHKI